ncbi:MAG TPA: hypothetical protein VMM76_23690 [Pirellulaceae bacterium]|nr:hypothetical protein [Pirellulaceae bacterium]
MTTKTLDAKGRVALGSDFAGKTVVIDNSNPACILIKPVVMIPEQEAWLYKNQAALNRVRQGLDDARNSNFAQQSPDVEADLEWLDDVED